MTAPSESAKAGSADKAGLALLFGVPLAFFPDCACCDLGTGEADAGTGEAGLLPDRSASLPPVALAFSFSAFRSRLSALDSFFLCVCLGLVRFSGAVPLTPLVE